MDNTHNPTVPKKMVIKMKKPLTGGYGGCPPTVAQILADNPMRSVWSAVMEQNVYDKMLLVKVMDHLLPLRIQKDYYSLTSERLQGQWHFGMISHNIKPGNVACKHGCHYCYETPTPGQDRYKRPMRIVEIEEMMPTDVKRVNESFPKVANTERKVYFFPSTCDVFVENALDYVTTCRNLINAGHEIFFVTKPSIDHKTGLNSVKEIVRIIENDPNSAQFKSKMVIFITITTDDNKLIQSYEPHASPYEVRIETLQFLIEHRFNTNVMMEPYLSDPEPIVRRLLPILEKQGVNGIIAIGQMNYIPRLALIQSDPIKKTHLQELYGRANIARLWDFVKTQNRVFLKKASVSAVLRGNLRSPHTPLL